MFINTPTAIPTKVPLKPYNPFRISSQEYPAIRAVDVLTTVPNRARPAIYKELQAIPANIKTPDQSLF